MNALTIRIALIAAAATLAVSTVSRNAEAQTRSVAGLAFFPSGSWKINEIEAGFGFKPQVSYLSYRGLIKCCTISTCTFKRDDTAESTSAAETVADPYVIEADTAFSGLKANDNGTPKRYGFDLTANCVLTFGPGGVMPFKGSSNIRPARFTLTVTR
jgi:hypothetical protein